MNNAHIKKININWGVVGIILIGLYLAIGWFARGYVDEYQAKKAAMHKAEVGVGGGPPEKITGRGLDMLCVPLDEPPTAKKALQEI